VDELGDATLHFVAVVDRALQVVVLQLEELVEVRLHFILHLDGVAEEDFGVDAGGAVLAAELKLLELLVVLVLQLVDRIVIEEPHRLTNFGFTTGWGTRLLLITLWCLIFYLRVHLSLLWSLFNCFLQLADLLLDVVALQLQ